MYTCMCGLNILYTYIMLHSLLLSDIYYMVGVPDRLCDLLMRVKELETAAVQDCWLNWRVPLVMIHNYVCTHVHLQLCYGAVAHNVSPH